MGAESLHTLSHLNGSQVTTHFVSQKYVFITIGQTVTPSQEAPQRSFQMIGTITVTGVGSWSCRQRARCHARGFIHSLKHPVVIISILQFRKLQGGLGLPEGEAHTKLCAVMHGHEGTSLHQCVHLSLSLSLIFQGSLDFHPCPHHLPPFTLCMAV